VDYLDVHIELRYNCIYYRVHQKPLNTYQYPLYTSNLTPSGKDGFISGECIRYLRLYSEELDFHMMKCKFAFRLRNHSYLPSFYRCIMDKVKWCDRAKHRTINQPNTTIPLIFRLTYRNNFMALTN